MKKLTVEKETLELHLQNEKDEKELYKVTHCGHACRGQGSGVRLASASPQ